MEMFERGWITSERLNTVYVISFFNTLRLSLTKGRGWLMVQIRSFKEDRGWERQEVKEGSKEYDWLKKKIS